MAAEPRRSRRGKYVVIALVIVLIAAAAGAVVRIPISSAIAVPYGSTSTGRVPFRATSVGPYTVGVPTRVAYNGTSALVIASVHESTVTQQVVVVSRTTIYCNQSVYSRYVIGAGADVHLSWNATAKVDVYVLNFSQYIGYQAEDDSDEGIGESIGNWTARAIGVANGALQFQAPAMDSYYFYIFNPSMNDSCVGPIGILSAEGSAVYGVPVTSYSTSLTTYSNSSDTTVLRTSTTTVVMTRTSTELVPYTLTSTSTATCSPSVWAWLLGQKSC